jgi:hypothetical protein
LEDSVKITLTFTFTFQRSKLHPVTDKYET